MNAAIHIPTANSRSEPTPGICRRVLRKIAVKLMVAFVLAPGLTGSARAIDQPPQAAPQQRAWILSHLVTDMQSVGSFNSSDIAQMVTLVNTLTDDQVSLLTRFYYLTREKTEQDAQLYAEEQTDTSAALAAAKAQVAGLLSQLQNQIEQTYSELATINPGCETLCQVAYASVPGWCAYNQYAIPDWYYNNGCYVGPVYSANYCGAYAVPLYNTFYNRSSRYNFWNSRAYLGNNSVRIGRPGASLVHDSRLPMANHAPPAIVNHNPPKLHNLAAVAKKRVGAPAVRHVSKARPAGHSKPRAVAHNHSRPAAHPKAHVQAHAAPRPHPQHVAHVARAQSGHGRRR